MKKEINRDLVTILANVIGVSPNFIKPIWEKHHHNLLTGNITSKEFVRILVNEINYPDDINKIYSEWAGKVSITQNSINHNLINFISVLHKKYKLYVLSNMIDLAEEDKILKRLKQQFDGYFTSYHLRARKPQPEMFHKFLARTNLKPDQCIFIDDDEKNTSASTALGSHSVRYEDVEKLKIYLSDL